MLCMAYWLVKTEADTYSVDDLKKDKITVWEGVRNYQARNFLCSMKKGDLVLIYHSVSEPVGIAGLAEVVKEAYPDPSQFERKSRYYEEKSSRDNPRWFSPDLQFVKKFKQIIALSEIRKQGQLKDMLLLKKGSRLSVQPVEPKDFRYIVAMAERSGAKG